MKRMNPLSKLAFSLLATALLFLTSCGETVVDSVETGETSGTNIESGGATLQATGRAGELVVVCDETLWSDQLIANLDSTMNQPFEQIYPYTNRLSVRHLVPSKWDQGNKRIRNLMVIELNDKIEAGKPLVELKTDVYGVGQIVTYITANNQDDLELAAATEMEGPFRAYDQKEWLRIVAMNNRVNNTALDDLTAKKFGVTLEVPIKSELSVNKKNYVRIQFQDESRPMDFGDKGSQGSQSNFIQGGVQVWSYDFIDSSYLSKESLMNARDTILKKFFPHSMDDVYMGTQDHELVEPVVHELTVNGIKGYEFQGMYKFTGAQEPSGGCFRSFHFLHPKTNRITAISAYTTAPPTVNWATMLRKIQGVVYSVNLTE